MIWSSKSAKTVGIGWQFIYAYVLYINKINVTVFAKRAHFGATSDVALCIRSERALLPPYTALYCAFASCFRFRGMLEQREEWWDYIFEETAFKHLLPVKTATLRILPCYIWCHCKHGFTSARLASLSTSTLPTGVHPVCAQHSRMTSDSSGRPPTASVMTLRCKL